MDGSYVDLEGARRSLASLEGAARAELAAAMDLEASDERGVRLDAWRRRRLLANVVDMLRAMPAKWEEIEAAADMADTPEREAQLRTELGERKRTHDALKRDWKRAQAQVRKNAIVDEQDVRKTLLEGAKEEVEDVSRSTTETLQATRSLMQQELERGGAAVNALRTSDAKLEEANRKVKEQHPLLKTSKKLMNTIYRNDMSERASLYLGFSFFMAVVAYILTKRLVGIPSWKPWNLAPTKTAPPQNEELEIPRANQEGRVLYQDKEKPTARQKWKDDRSILGDAVEVEPELHHAKSQHEWPHEEEKDAVEVEEVYASVERKVPGKGTNRPTGESANDVSALNMENAPPKDEVTITKQEGEHTGDTMNEDSALLNDTPCTQFENGAGHSLSAEEQSGPDDKGHRADPSSVHPPQNDRQESCSNSLCTIDFGREEILDDGVGMTEES